MKIKKLNFSDWNKKLAIYGGKKTITDFKKRLVKALKDDKLNNKKVKKFLIWMEDAIKYFNHNNESGALMVCKLIKK